MTRLNTLCAVVSVLALVPAGRADELADLLNRVPADMNTVAVINVREINKSPRAVRENWKENRETEYLAGAIAIPGWVPVVVIAADLHPGALAVGRSIALFPADTTVSSESIAKRELGVVQSIGDSNIVLSPRRGYMGVPARGVVGVSSTIPRQDFVHWMRASAKAERPTVAPYLVEAVAAHKSDHIVIASDLSDQLDPTMLRTALQQSGMGEAGLTSLVNVLTGARGLTFVARVGDVTRADLRIDFGVPMDEFVGQFQDVWPRALESAGFEIEEFKSAKMKAEGKAVVLSADLSDTSLRRILSLVHAPGDAVGSQESTSSSIRTPKEAAVLATSLRYYRAVNSALDDLKAQGGARGKDYARSAVFFDSYATKIQKLPLGNADPVLVRYGASVTAKLHAMAGSLRGLKAQLEAFDSYKSVTYATGGGAYVTPGGWIGVAPGWNPQMSSNVEALSARQAELVAALEPERAKIWSVLEGDRSTLRRELLEKYKIDFEQYKK